MDHQLGHPQVLIHYAHEVVIDELNLKGTKIGGAEISTKHAGFIINTHSATSKDVKQLISFIQEKVKSATNEDLEPEIEFVEY